MRHNSVYIKITSCFVILTFLTIPCAQSSNNLQAKMQQMFGDMTNVTQPRAYQGQSRGVVDGGSVVNRSRVVNLPGMLGVGIQLPAAKAGCGGIDLYLGGFSFISGDEFVAFAKAVASNAKGLLFQMAINVVSSVIGSTLSDALKKIQDMTNGLKNSCEAAQWMIKKTPAQEWADTATQKANQVLRGQGRDETGIQNSPNSIGDTGSDSKFLGNLAYEVMKKQPGLFEAGFGLDSDNGMFEEIMSFTGTYITGDAAENNYVEFTPILSVRDVVGTTKETVEVFKYKCVGDTPPKMCTSVNPVAWSGPTMVQRVKTMLHGEDGSSATSGILYKLKAGKRDMSTSLIWTEEEKRFMETWPPDIGANIRNLAVSRSQDSCVLFADKVADYLAIRITEKVMRDVFKGLETAVSRSGHPQANDYLARIKESKAVMEADVESLLAETGRPEDFAQYYKVLLEFSMR